MWSRLALSSGLVLASAAAGVGCSDFATPAQLAAPTIIAVVAEPPVAAPGAQSRLHVVIAGPDGLIDPAAFAAAPTWSLAETYPDIPPLGTIEPADDDPTVAIYTAPQMVPPLPDGVLPIDSARLDVEVDGRMLAAVKAVPVTELSRANPAVTALSVGGDEADAITVASGETVELSIAVDPEPGEDASFAWYSTIGTIERYQSNPVELAATTAEGATPASTGTLFVVVRDGVGGMAWRSFAVTVE